MIKRFIPATTLCLLAASFGFAMSAQAHTSIPSCEQIKTACESAGFVKGQAKEGNGLWRDCVDPIMRGTTQPKKAGKPLPQVDATAVSDCKAKDPQFGEGKKVGAMTPSTTTTPQ